MKKKEKTAIIIPIIIISLSIIGYIYFTELRNTPYKPIKYVKTIKYNSNSSIFNEISDYDAKIIKNYDDYINFQSKYNIDSNIKKENFEDNYYVIVFAENDYCGGSINGIRNVDYKESKVEIDIGYNGSCGPCPSEYKLYIVPLEKEKVNINTTIVNYKYTVENKYHCNPAVAYKPLIYLYPETTTNVTVKLLKTENLTTTYPKYEKEWNVTAYKDGTLIDNKTGRSLYGLYWEGKNYESSIKKEGFVVKGSNTIKFLEEKLSKLGLTEREANEFIIYWLPKLEHNKYNYIHFNTEISDKIMPIEVNPKPDTNIRILMEYKPLNKKMNIKEQEIKTPQRKGFTLVEWGGTEIKK